MRVYNKTVDLSTSGGHCWLGLNLSLGAFPLIGAELPGLEQRALTKAINKLRQGDLDLGVFIAELNQTARLLVTTANRIARDVRRFRKKYDRWIVDRDYRRRRRQLKRRKIRTDHIDKQINSRKRNVWEDVKRGCFRCKGASAWLELQYGWIPLLNDLYAAINDLSQEWFEEGVYVRVASKAEDTTNRSQTYSPWQAGISYCTPMPATVKMVTEHKCVVALWFKCVNPNQAVVGSLGLNNPASIVWEKVRYSFVVDWLLPIGPWLSSFGADYGFEFKSGSRSYKREASGSVTSAGGFKAHSGYTMGATGGLRLNKYKAEFFRRTVYESRPVPGFYFKNPFTTKHVISALALLVQAFR